jgi:hypothetical protein
MDSSHRSNYPARRTLLFPSLDFFKFSFEQSVTSVSFEFGYSRLRERVGSFIQIVQHPRSRKNNKQKQNLRLSTPS